MYQRLDLTGKIFNYLRVVKRHKHKNAAYVEWACRCVCGKTIYLPPYKLISGHPQSCGCKKDYLIGIANTRHGHTKDKISRTYNTWSSMKARCNNLKSNNAKHYGRKGIRVCDRWSSFPNFLKDMGEKPDGMTLERIDSKGNYSPQNCRWATYTEQANNKSSNRIVLYKGTKDTLANACRKANVDYHMVHRRIQKGWAIEDAIYAPLDVSRRTKAAKEKYGLSLTNNLRNDKR